MILLVLFAVEVAIVLALAHCDADVDVDVDLHLLANHSSGAFPTIVDLPLAVVALRVLELVFFCLLKLYESGMVAHCQDPPQRV